MTSVETNRFDPEIQNKINRLNNDKLQAVAVEDFDMAKHFKSIIDKLKVLGNQMVVLQQEKDHAIENEDYDMAKQIKMQLEHVSQFAYQIGEVQQQQQYQEQPYQQSEQEYMP